MDLYLAWQRHSKLKERVEACAGGQRASQESTRSISSGRSSFAMENVAPGQQLADSRLPSLDCTRPSLEAFNALPPRSSFAVAQQHRQQTQRSQQAQPSRGGQAAAPQGLLGLCSMLGVQPSMQQALGRLAAVARDLPVPMRMLVKHPFLTLLRRLRVLE